MARMAVMSMALEFIADAASAIPATQCTMIAAALSLKDAAGRAVGMVCHEETVSGTIGKNGNHARHPVIAMPTGLSPVRGMAEHSAKDCRRGMKTVLRNSVKRTTTTRRQQPSLSSLERKLTILATLSLHRATVWKKSRHQNLPIAAVWHIAVGELAVAEYVIRRWVLQERHPSTLGLPSLALSVCSLCGLR